MEYERGCRGANMKILEMVFFVLFIIVGDVSWWVNSGERGAGCAGTGVSCGWFERAVWQSWCIYMIYMTCNVYFDVVALPVCVCKVRACQLLCIAIPSRYWQGESV